jgi:5'-deoxynucleotidase YfbR-like HD superfamily hydrolase
MPPKFLPEELRDAVPQGPWIQTYSGNAFPLLNPEPMHVRLRDIAEHLSKITRFTGATRWPYSVAQHSLFVADIVASWGRSDAERYAYLHDGKEAYIGDVATPIKRALEALGARGVLERLEDPIDRAIHARFNLDWPPPADVAQVVRHADLVALATERRDLLLEGPDWGINLPAPTARRIEQAPWHFEDAVERFHQRAVKLELVRTR